MIRHPEPSAAPAAQRSVSRAVVVSIAVILAITERLHPAPDAGPCRPERHGRPGRQHRSRTGRRIGGRHLPRGRLQRRLATPSSPTTCPVIGNDGEAGTWSFFTTAAPARRSRCRGAGPGLHAWFNVTARLDAVVVRGGTLVSTDEPRRHRPARSAAPSPSNGFDYAGTANFNVQPGDVYGFVLRGSNGDVNDLLRGELTLGNVDTRVVRRCPGALRRLRPRRRPLRHPPRRRTALYRPLRRHADPGRRRDYLEIRNGPGLNYGQYAAGGAAVGRPSRLRSRSSASTPRR